MVNTSTGQAVRWPRHLTYKQYDQTKVTVTGYHHHIEQQALFHLMANLKVLLPFTSQATLSPTASVPLLLRTPVINLSPCLIRELGGNSISSGLTEDDKWIARTEKLTQIHPLLDFLLQVHDIYCSPL